MKPNNSSLWTRLFPARAEPTETARLSAQMRQDVGLPPKHSTDLPKLYWL